MGIKLKEKEKKGIKPLNDGLLMNTGSADRTSNQSVLNYGMNYNTEGVSDEQFNESLINTMAPDAKAFIKEYHQSPMYEKRFKKAQIKYTKEYGKTAGSVASLYNNHMETIDKRFSETDNLNVPSNSIVDQFNQFINDDYGSYYNFEENRMQLDPQQELPGGNMNAVAAHEYSHMASNPEGKYGLDKNDRTISLGQQGAIQRGMSNIRDGHDADVYETKADVDALRYMLNKDGLYNTMERDFTEDDYNKAEKRFNGEFTFERLKRLHGKDNIINLMNTLAQNNQKTSLYEGMA